MRVHSFDDGFQEAASGEPAVGRELVPDGEHTFTIREASEGPHRFPDSYPGDFLHLTLAADGPYSLVWVSIGVGEKDKALAASLAKALGFTPKEWAGADPLELKGRKVNAVTRQVVSRAGNTRVYVNAFKEDSFRADFRKPAARTPAAKVAAAKGEEHGGADDVPFVWVVPMLTAAGAFGAAVGSAWNTVFL